MASCTATASPPAPASVRQNRPVHSQRPYQHQPAVGAPSSTRSLASRSALRDAAPPRSTQAVRLIELAAGAPRRSSARHSARPRQAVRVRHRLERDRRDGRRRTRRHRQASGRSSARCSRRRQVRPGSSSARRSLSGACRPASAPIPHAVVDDLACAPHRASVATDRDRQASPAVQQAVGPEHVDAPAHPRVRCSVDSEMLRLSPLTIAVRRILPATSRLRRVQVDHRGAGVERTDRSQALRPPRPP